MTAPVSSSPSSPTTAAGQIGLVRFAVIAAQLALVFLVIRQFQIESAAFLRVALLAFAGFAVHAFLPLPWRLPFFTMLSIAAIGVVLGVHDGAWIVALALILIGICHLPVAFRWRVALLVGVGALFAVQRVAWLPAPWSPAVWPILGSMFMFRLVIYLYELKHETVPASPAQALAYFFLLPNVCFPLFPVVDYKTFRRNYFDADPGRLYQTGVDWIVRGVMHLIMYRVVYYYLTLSPSEVRDPYTFAQYVVSTFLLYLRISGQFHVIVGMLYLFGFRLPETHHLYYLASSFTDFWRRINIYWKDFMLKIFFNPLYFALRRFGPTRALVISTFAVFLATWALHAYQWFWLRGSFLIAGTDIAFWTILAGLVVANALRESRRGRVRTLGKRQWTMRSLSMRTLQTAGMFATIALLWSLWTAESFSAWFALWRGMGEGARPGSATLWSLVGLGAVVAMGSGGGGGSRTTTTIGFSARVPWSTVGTVVSLAVLSLLGVQSVYTRLGPDAATFVNSLRSGQLSRVDQNVLERGYYEELVRVDRFNGQLWEVYMNRPRNWLDVQGLGLERFTGDFRQKELVPSRVIQTRFGPIRTNRWGMRDLDYELAPAPGTYRFAMLGASTVMGWGVADDEGFEALVEQRLNQSAPSGHQRYEILNLAVPGFQSLTQAGVIDKALKFSPHAVLYVAIGRELQGASQYLAETLSRRVPIPYEPLREIARKAGVEPGTDETTAARRLEPHRTELLSWLYPELVRACRDRHAVPVFVFLPQPYHGIWEREVDETLRLATAAGFVVLDLRDTFRDVELSSIHLADWDKHPNVRGHQLMAARLHRALLEHTDPIFGRREARP